MDTIEAVRRGDPVKLRAGLIEQGNKLFAELFKCDLSENAKFEMVHVLSVFDLDVNRMIDGFPPLSWEVMRDNPSVPFICKLLEMGASIYQENNFGSYPLQLAVTNNRLEVVEQFKSRININRRDIGNQLITDHPMTNEMLELLQRKSRVPRDH